MLSLHKQQKKLDFIKMPKNNVFYGSRNTSPKKLLGNWLTLNDDHVYERCLLTPLFLHNALVETLNDRREERAS